MYKVSFEGSNDRQQFLFPNYDDAFNFASMAVEAGTYQDYHFDGNTKVEEPAHPLKVTVQGVDE